MYFQKVVYFQKYRFWTFLSRFIGTVILPTNSQLGLYRYRANIWLENSCEYFTGTVLWVFVLFGIFRVCLVFNWKSRVSADLNLGTTVNLYTVPVWNGCNACRYIHTILWLSADSFVFNFCGSAFWVIYFYPVSILSVQSGSNNGWSPYSNLGWSLGAVWRTESPWFQNIVRVSCGLGIGARVFYSRMLEMYWVGLCVDFPSNQISITTGRHLARTLYRS